MKEKVITILGFATIFNTAIAQNGVNAKWDKQGDAPTNNASKLGTKNNQGFSIITNNQSAVDVGANGIFNFLKPVNFINKVTFDSLRVSKYLVSDSIKARVLRVGNNSLFLGGVAGPGPNDNIQSTAGVINMGNTGTFANLNLSIGSTFLGPFSAARARLFVNGRTGMNITNPLSTLGINGNQSIGASFGSLNAPSNGFIVEGFTGIGTSNPVRQLEVYTPAITPQMRVTRFLGTHFTDVNVNNNGDYCLLATNTTLTGNLQQRFVGIQTNTPGNTLEINSQAATTAQSFAGLRFTDLNSTSPTLLNPSNKVLSVDANGDVVLVPDGPGGGGGATNVTAQNGLSNISPSIVEWGGTLLHDTYIDQAGYNIWWHNQGAFTHGASIPLSGTLNYKFGLLNQNFDKAMVINSSNVVSGTSSSQQLGLEIINNTPNLIAPGYTNKGIIVYNSGSYDNRNNFFSSVNGGVTPSPAPVVPGAFSYGVDAGAYNTDNSYGGSFAASTLDPNATLQYGIFAQADRGIDVRGVVGKVRYFGDGVAGSLSAGLWGETEANSTSNFGSFNYVAPNSGYQAGRLYFGTYSEVNTNGSTNSPTNVYGVFSRVFTPNNIVPGAQVYAVYGQATDINSYAGFFNGDVNVTGQLTAGVYGPSDQLLKTNINNITNAKGIISQLEPKSFFMDTTKYFLKGHTQKNYGLIAQQVQTVVPELVSTFNAPNKTDSLGNILQMGGIFKTLNYNAFIGILLANAKEQNARIDSLIAALGSSARAANPNNPQPTEVNNSNTSVNKHAVTLSKADMLVLDQNQPNPFNEKTIITYNVPEKYGYAQIIFTTTEGKIIKIADITQKGAGELTVYANDLSAGIYQYSLVVDGKTIETKKMIKQ